MNKKIAQGAESIILQIDNTTLKKLRLPKPYRLEIIDNKLRKFRTKREFKVLNTLKENKINVPKTKELITNNEELSFTFEYIPGNVLKLTLDQSRLTKAFNQIIKMHNCDIVHKDLTTLNMIDNPNNNKIYLIDFGLSDFSNKIEDKAVDLNLFFTCIKNEHTHLYNQKEKLEQIYLKKTTQGDKIIKRLHKIEHRGRNK